MSAALSSVYWTLLSEMPACGQWAWAPMVIGVIALLVKNPGR